MPDQAVPLGRMSRTADHPLITVAETARMLGCSNMTIRRRIDARQFPAVKIGRKAMVPRAFVERLLAAAASGRTVVVEEITAEWAADQNGSASMAREQAALEAIDVVPGGVS